MSRAADAIQFIRDLIITADTDAGSRVYLTTAPQSATYPLIVLDFVSGAFTPTQEDGSVLDTYRIQIDCLAEPSSSASAFVTAMELANEVRRAISRQEDTENYTNTIDSIQEDAFRTAQFTEPDIYLVSFDYMVRVK